VIAMNAAPVISRCVFSACSGTSPGVTTTNP
jgi:hypothetical protein